MSFIKKPKFTPNNDLIIYYSYAKPENQSKISTKMPVSYSTCYFAVLFIVLLSASTGNKKIEFCIRNLLQKIFIALGQGCYCDKNDDCDYLTKLFFFLFILIKQIFKFSSRCYCYKNICVYNTGIPFVTAQCSRDYSDSGCWDGLMIWCLLRRFMQKLFWHRRYEFSMKKHTNIC
jgi:hypothetical protein